MISICMPTYNYGHYIGKAIESCLSQDQDFELVVLDDNSTDDTLDVLERYRDDPRVRIFSNPARVTIQQNWNRAVSLCTRPWVKMLHADDALRPGAIAAFERMLVSLPEAQFHGFLAEIIDSAGVVVRRHRPFTGDCRYIELSGPRAIKAKLRQQARFREPSCNMFRKSAWAAVGGYEEKYRFVFDIHFNSKLMNAVPSALWSEHWTQLRRHKQSDGARLPAELALTELARLSGELLAMLGPEADFADHCAARGWFTYRVFELAVSRLRTNRSESLQLLWTYRKSLADWSAMLYSARLLRNRCFFGDVQQQF